MFFPRFPLLLMTFLLAGVCLTARPSAQAADKSDVPLVGPTENHVLRAMPVPAAKSSTQPSGVVLDGDLSDWDLSGAIVMTDDIEHPQKLVRVFAMYDAQAFYLALEFKDTTPMVSHVDPQTRPGASWCGDTVQLRINTGPDGTKDPIDPQRVAHIDAYWNTDSKQPQSYVVIGDLSPANGRPEKVIDHAIGKGVNVGFRMHPDKQGYTQQVRVAWSLICPDGKPLVAGQSFRMALEPMWGDKTANENPAERIVDLLNPKNPDRDSIWTKPTAFGTVELSPTGHVSPSPTANLWPIVLPRYEAWVKEVAAHPERIIDPATRPCLQNRNEVFKQINEWYAQGTAAGNVGDYYDNRDRGHSGLDLRQWPQMTAYVYPPEELSKDKDLNWGLMTTYRSFVTMGNSSTSDSPDTEGSNPRSAQLEPKLLAAQRDQYCNNNVYIYPEHRDYDLGRCNHEGWGDQYPLNTPYNLISQGSSGSDQPFMKAYIHALAAMPPKVKQTLVEHKLVMPTLHALLRASNLQVKKPEDYFTGKAHPIVFQGDQINELKFITLAHELTLDTIPPLAHVRVVEEDAAPLPGKNAPADCKSEILCDFPEIIGRVHRRWDRDLHITVSASDSSDLKNQPLTYRWVLLQGDPAKVKIEPSADGTQARLTIAWHDAFFIEKGKTRELQNTNRVDIGLFASNGQAWSLPACVSVYHPDNELRTYDAQNRLIDICYQAGDTSIGFATTTPMAGTGIRPYDIRQWAQFINRLTASDSPVQKLFAANLTNTQCQSILETIEEMNTRQSQYEARKKATALPTTKPAAVEQPPKSAVENICKPLLQPLPILDNLSTKDFLEKMLNDWKDNPTAYLDAQKLIDDAAAAINADAVKNLTSARQRLITLGIYQPTATGSWTLHSVNAGSAPVVQRLTQYERLEIQRFHLMLLNDILLPNIVSRGYLANFVDKRMGQAQPVWDVFTWPSDPAAECKIDHRKMP